MKIDAATATALNQANEKATNEILELVGLSSNGSVRCLVKGIIQENFQAALQSVSEPKEQETVGQISNMHACQKCGMPGAVLHFPGGYLCPNGCKNPTL